MCDILPQLNLIMKKILSIIFLALLVITLKPQAVSADCSQIYGGGQNCTTSNSFSIQKLVQKPGKGGGSYVNSLSINDPKYSPNQNVSFRVTVKNTGSQTIPSLTVTDAFPQFISFVSGPGNFDTASKTLTFTVSNLNQGQTVTYTIVGKISNSNLMPQDQAVLCLVNQVDATDENNMTNSSSSQFCIQKTVLGASVPPKVLPAPKIVKTPATGPEMLPLLALIPGGLAGFILRRKSNKTYKTGGEK